MNIVEYLLPSPLAGSHDTSTVNQYQHLLVFIPVIRGKNKRIWLSLLILKKDTRVGIIEQQHNEIFESLEHNFKCLQHNGIL